ncbi:MAG: hypothetical protein JSS49_22960 [Planctomycetes bacterium]|nr:hypothetical protein [Planctomycetota bacterium]
MSGLQLRKQKFAFAIVMTTAVIVMAVFDLFYGFERLSLDLETSPDEKVFARLFQLHNGDSIEKVSSLLGAPTIHADMVNVMRDFMAKSPGKFPEGVETGDVYLEFCCVQAGGIWLQARNGKLVNYDPEKFREMLDYR